MTCPHHNAVHTDLEHHRIPTPNMCLLNDGVSSADILSAGWKPNVTNFLRT